GDLCGAARAGTGRRIGYASGGRKALPADRYQQVLRVAVRDEGGLAGHVVVREAVGQVAQGVVVPELGVIVGRRRPVEAAHRLPLAGRQVGGVPVEGRALVRLARQGTRAPEYLLGGGADADA